MILFALLSLLMIRVGIDAQHEDFNFVPGDEKIYKALYKHKRAEQLEAVRRIMAIDDYTKQFKLVNLTLDQIAKVTIAAKTTLENAGYVPGGKFPEDDQVREALANVVENTALMGEILLRLPDVTHKLLDAKNDLRLLALWCVGFCEESPLVDRPTKVLLHLMAQEMGIAPRDPNYINPYRMKHQAQQQVKLNTKQETKPKKKKAPRGPQLSGTKQEL